MPQSYIDEGVRALYDAARQKQAQRAALIQQQLARQQAALDEQRLLIASEINDGVKDLPKDALKYPAVLHDIERERAMNEANYLRNSASLRAFGMPTGVAERDLKNVDKSISERYGNVLKDFEDTEQYKTAKENAGKLREVNQRINLVNGAVEKTIELVNSNDLDEASRHMRTNLIKPLNSILSNDAIQLSEMLIRYRDLLNAPEAAQLAGKSGFNPTAWMNQYLSAEKNPKEQESLLKDITEKAFRANPKRFLQTAVNGVNGYMNAYNKMATEQVINITSPGLAHKMGVVLFTPIELKKPDDKLPDVFPDQLATPQGQAIQGGSTQMPSQPAQQAVQSADDILKKYGVIK